MNLKKLLAKYWSIILLTLIVSTIIVSNLDPNRIIMGLDNASPYFSSEPLISKMHGTSLFIYGGLIFTMPFFSLLRLVNLSPEIQSQIYILGNLLLGTTGIYILGKTFLKDISNSIQDPKIGGYFSFLLYTFSLFTLWIFSQPNFLFLASYSTIPWIIYLLSYNDLNRPKKLNLFLTIIFSILFLTTSLNLIAFGLYIIQIVVISVLLKSFKKKASLLNIAKTPLLWALFIIIGWFLTLQIVSYLNHDTNLIFSYLPDYLELLRENPLMPDITRDLIASESQNSLFSSMRYLTGWIELHDIDLNPVFLYSSIYRSNLIFALIGTIPFALAITAVYLFKNSKNAKPSKSIMKSLTILGVTMLIGLLLISKYSISLINLIPYITDSLRWISSKLWPIYIIPLVLLASLGLVQIINLTKIPKSISITIITIVFLIYGFPLISGTIFSTHVQFNLPAQYQKLQNEVTPNSTILYLPPPQYQYFRQYDWGYFGSDFLSYILEADVIDTANLYEHAGDYDNLTQALDKCELDKLEHIDYIIYDHTVSTPNNETEYDSPYCVNNRFRKCKSIDNLDIYIVQ